MMEPTMLTKFIVTVHDNPYLARISTFYEDEQARPTLYKEIEARHWFKGENGWDANEIAFASPVRLLVKILGRDRSYRFAEALWADAGAYLDVKGSKGGLQWYVRKSDYHTCKILSQEDRDAIYAYNHKWDGYPRIRVDRLRIKR